MTDDHTTDDHTTDDHTTDDHTTDDHTTRHGPAGEGAAGEPAVSADRVKAALRKVKDPELGLNIIDLGLVYGIAIDGATVSVDMTLTTPACPSGPEIMRDAEHQIRAMPGVEDVTMNLVWDPYWTPDKIEPRVRAYLGF